MEYGAKRSTCEPLKSSVSAKPTENILEPCDFWDGNQQENGVTFAHGRISYAWKSNQSGF